MTKFDGFADNMRYSSIPSAFFSSVMPHISDIDELKATLQAIRLLIPKKGYPKYITFQELLKAGPKDEATLQRGLKLAATRGILLHLKFEKDAIYLLNTLENREAAAKITSGQISIGHMPKKDNAEIPVQRPNIFDLYEQNVGILTPMIAEELKEAEDMYPPAWIEEAIKEAVSLNIRKWRYIASILERWTAEGKDDGKTGQNSKKDKYFKSKYSHLYQR